MNTCRRTNTSYIISSNPPTTGNCGRPSAGIKDTKLERVRVNRQVHGKDGNSRPLRGHEPKRAVASAC